MARAILISSASRVNLSPGMVGVRREGIAGPCLGFIGKTEVIEKTWRPPEAKHQPLDTLRAIAQFLLAVIGGSTSPNTRRKHVCPLTRGQILRRHHVNRQPAESATRQRAPAEWLPRLIPDACRARMPWLLEPLGMVSHLTLESLLTPPEESASRRASLWPARAPKSSWPTSTRMP